VLQDEAGDQLLDEQGDPMVAEDYEPAQVSDAVTPAHTILFDW
jgi:hypothetical protein